MTIQEYQAFCAQGVLEPTKARGPEMIFGLGLTGEAGEVADIIKKHFGHGKLLDINHMSEELGDVMWYVANLCNVFNLDLQKVIEQNSEKLRGRYPKMYKE